MRLKVQGTVGRGEHRGRASGPVAFMATAIGTLSLAAGIALAGINFQAPVPYATDTRPIDIAIGKLDGDGRKDIAVANRDGRTVSVLLGQGGGAFADAENLETGGPQPQGVAIGDLDDDGRQDLIAAGDDEVDQVLVFRGKAGGFRNPKSYPVPGSSNLSHVAVADLDRDGRLDVVVSDSDQEDRFSVYVLYGTANGLGAPKRMKLRSNERKGF